MVSILDSNPKRPTGVKFIGGWKDDKQHGEGKTVDPDGEEIINNWENGSKIS